MYAKPCICRGSPSAFPEQPQQPNLRLSVYNQSHLCVACPVRQNSDPVDGTAALKVELQLLGRAGIVNVTHIYGAGICLRLGL